MVSLTETVSEAVGVFHSVECLESAIDELQNAGFNRSELSLLAHDKAVEEKLGHIYKKAEDAADDPEAPRMAWASRNSVDAGEAALVGAPFFIAALVAGGAVVATGGALLPAIGAAVAAGGLAGTFGGLVAGELGKEHAAHYEQQLERGGILLWVHLRKPEDGERVVDILQKNKADHVHVHQIAASA
ncbi:MAG: hypothetical protein J4G10_05505 [Alphaproteobacteria bacterium]|nr:hypothetical protein [Alphaproteobacteria bacterium]